MARKQKHEEHENHERWLVSYADFITLLFAFFVVMYSISSVNEGKYRVLSDTLVAAFRGAPKSVVPIQVGQPAKIPAAVDFNITHQETVIRTFDLPLPAHQDGKSPYAQKGEPGKAGTGAKATAGAGKEDKAAKDVKGAATATAGGEHLSNGEIAVKRVADDVEKAMGSLIAKNLIAVRRNKQWVEVEIRTSILFPSGSATLSAAALPVLEQLAKILTPFPNPIHVEGFTDDVPINTPVFPSNWELSAARAASVVHLFTEYGVDPNRMAAVGFGEYHPVASNDTADGRSRNRRVVLVILAGDDPRQAVQAPTPRTVAQALAAPAAAPAGAPAAADSTPAAAANAAPAAPAGAGPGTASGTAGAHAAGGTP